MSTNRTELVRLKLESIHIHLKHNATEPQAPHAPYTVTQKPPKALPACTKSECKRSCTDLQLRGSDGRIAAAIVVVVVVVVVAVVEQ